MNELQVSIIVNQDTTIQKQKEIIDIADTLHSNNSVLIDDLKASNRQLRKKVFKEKVKVKLVTIGGIIVTIIGIVAL